MVDHHAVVKYEVLLSDADGERGPAYFLAGTHESNLHTNTESDRH
jgi:hypothetical protein